MHACGTRLLRDAADRVLDLLRRDHHQIGKLVDDDDDLRQHLILLGSRGLTLCGGRLRLRLFRAHEVVIADQIAHLMICEQLVAAFHLADRPVERTGRLLRVGYDRNEQMRNAVVVAQLDHLRVYHDEADLLRGRFIEQRDQHGVDADRFTGTGRTGDQHMRHLGDVPDDRPARDVLAYGEGQAALCVREGVRADAFADKDRVDRLVRHLDADGGFIRDRRDAHVRRAERERNIIGKRRNARDLDAARNSQLKTGDGRAAHDADDLRVDIEGLERIEQTGRALAQLALRTGHRGVLSLRQQVDRRIGVDRRGGLLALVHRVVHRRLLILRDALGLFRLRGRLCRLCRRRLGFGFILRLVGAVGHELHDAVRLFFPLLLARLFQTPQIFIRRERLALLMSRIDRRYRAAGLILAGRIAVDRDVKVRGLAACAALLALLRVRSVDLARDLVHVRQLHRLFIACALLFVLVFVLGRAEHVDEHHRGDAAGDHDRGEREQQQHDQCARARQRPFEHDVQHARKQAARMAFHAGFQQIPYCFHRKIVLVRAGDGMDDAAEQDGQQADARAAQANRSLRTQEQQRAQRKQRKRQKQAAAADEAADEAVQPAQQRAVDGQQREKGQNAQSRPDRTPCRAAQSGALLHFGCRFRLFPRARCAFFRFWFCGFSCSQNIDSPISKQFETG